MKRFPLTYKPFGENALLIEWPAQMHKSILTDILSLQQAIEAHSLNGITEIIQSIHSLTIIYEPEILDFGTLKNWLTKLYSDWVKHDTVVIYLLWKIPVCYHTSFGLDLQELEIQNKLSAREIIEIHSKTIYQIFSIGFLPGFLYLGGLDKRLHIDRKPSPRLQTEKGAVGIGGAQTGIYPSESPGGWQIIGNTPINLFNTSQNPPCFAKAGDKVQFIPISLEEHQAITNLVPSDLYLLEKEVLNA